MKRRFQNYTYVFHFFKYLQLISLIYDGELYKAAEILPTNDDPNISSDFISQILSLRSCFKNIILIK